MNDFEKALLERIDKLTRVIIDKQIDEIEPYSLDSFEDLIITALHIDGAHHKQWFLERLLERISGENYEDIKKREEWDEGIIP